MAPTRKNILVAACSAACALFAGCASDNTKDIAALREFLQKQPAQEPRTRVVVAEEYRVLPPDMISISSRHVFEIDKQTQVVRPDGVINLPLVGEVEVAGRTPKQIEAMLITASSKYYQEADATVQVIGFNSQKIFVFGQVALPGPQPWTGCDTLLDVLAKVQPTYLAWPERIRVVRAKEPKRGGYVPYFRTLTASVTTAPDSTQPEAAPAAFGFEIVGDPNMSNELEVDMMAMVRRGDMSRNVLLYPNDVVYVPANPFGEVGLALQTVFFPIQPIIQAVQLPVTIQNAIPGQSGK